MLSFSFALLVGIAAAVGRVSAQVGDGVDFDLLSNSSLTFENVAQDDVPLRVMFVNQFPDQSVDLYWEDHKYPHDHPDRRKLEARIPPRGGWHASETFLRHGKSDLS